MSFIRHLCCFLALTCAAPALYAARSEALGSPRATVTLLSATDVAAPGQTVDLGLHFRFQPGWHIYWMNPGDAGQAPRIEVFAPAGSVLGEVSWPAPERHVDGPITTFVHQGEVLLPFTVTLPPALAGTAALSVKANWLVCKDICIPEEGVFRLELPAGTAQDSPDAALFEAACAALPLVWHVGASGHPNRRERRLLELPGGWRPSPRFQQHARARGLQRSRPECSC